MQLVHLTDLKAWGHWGDEVSLQPMPMSDVHVHVSQVLQACKAHLIALKRRGAVCITCQGHALLRTCPPEGAGTQARGAAIAVKPEVRLTPFLPTVLPGYTVSRPHRVPCGVRT